MSLLPRLLAVCFALFAVGWGAHPTFAQVSRPGGGAWESGKGTETVIWGEEGSRVLDRSEDEECREEPGACILGTVLAYVVVPIFETLFTDFRVATQPLNAPLGLRLDHRFRSVGEGARAHPYLGLGVRFIRESSSYGGRRPVEAYFEAAAGYQFGLEQVVGSGSLVQRNAVLGTEAQWLSNTERNRFRIEVAPGLAINQSADQRWLVHLTLGVTAAGDGAGTVSPGLSLGYRW